MGECFTQCCHSRAWFSFDQGEFNDLPIYNINLQGWLMFNVLCIYLSVLRYLFTVVKCGGKWTAFQDQSCCCLRCCILIIVIENTLIVILVINPSCLIALLMSFSCYTMYERSSFSVIICYLVKKIFSNIARSM